MTAISKRYLLCFFFALIGCNSVAQQPLVPVATTQLSSLMTCSSRPCEAHVKFLTDNSLALAVCADDCRIEVLEFQGTELKERSRASLPLFAGLYSMNGRVLLGWILEKKGAVLLDSELQMADVLPSNIRHNISRSGETFAWQVDKERWIAYRTAKPHSQMAEGAGHVLSISDNAIATLQNGEIRIQTLGGSVLGTFPHKAAKITPRVVLLEDGKVFYWVRDPEIRDLNGKTVRKLPKPVGWGMGVQPSRDGSRLLFENYTRQVSLPRKIEESGEALLTLGMSADSNTNNRQAIRVINTQTGNVCFDVFDKFEDSMVFLGARTAINPSGTLVAIIGQGKLRVYRLPTSCL